MVFGVLFVLSAVMIMIAALTFQLQQVQLTGDSLIPFSSGWRQVRDGALTEETWELPARLETETRQQESEVRLRNTLPDALQKGSVLFLTTNHQRIQAFCEGRLLYEYGYEQQTSFGKMFGKALHQIPLSSEIAGKTIELRYAIPNSFSKLEIGTISLGSKSAVVLQVVRKNFGRLLFTIATLAAGLLFLLLAGIFWRRRFTFSSYRAFFWLGMICILSALWVFFDSNLLQFFTSNLSVGYLISFFSFMLLPIAFLMYFREMCQRNWKGLHVFFILYAAHVLAVLLLYLCHVVELMTSVMVTHLFVLALIGLISYIGIKEVRLYQNKAMITTLSGIGILELSIVLSLILYYGQRFDYTLLFRIGLLVFIAFLGKAVIRGTVHLLRNGMEAEIYRNLAYTDVLTGISNRSAYEKRMAQLEGNFKKYKSISLLVFDLDHLKAVNDSYGHAQGDHYIKEFAAALKRCFTGKNVPYRIGGDEFVALLLDEKTTQPYIERLKEQVKQHNQGSETKLAFSWGEAKRLTNGLERFDGDALFQEADSRLYQMKKKEQNR